MRILLTSTAAVLFAAGAAYADMSWDANADSNVDREEFRAGLGENAFGKWDADQDGMLSRDEYDAGVEMQDDADGFGTWDDRYSEWDADQDEMLSRDEYEEGLWTSYDADQDDLWNQEETTAWEEDEMRYDATRSGREISPPG